MRNKTTNILFWIVVLVILAFLPKILSIYHVNAFVGFAIFAIFAVAVNMLLGYTGLLSFGHAMFFGFGGYGTAIALTHIKGLSIFGAIGIGFLSAMVLALILCPLVVRVSGTAFAMLHLAFGEFFYVLALKLRTVTRGEDGLGNFPIPDINIPGIASIPIKADPVNFYYLCMVIILIMLWMMWFITKTPFGQVQVAMRDNAMRVDYLGYKVPQSKAVVYVLSAVFSGLAGSLYALFHNLVSVDGSLSGAISFMPVTAVMIGGIGSFFGPIWGMAFLQILEGLSPMLTEQAMLMNGIIVILVVMFAPYGLHGFYMGIKMKWQKPTAAASKMEKTS